MNSKEFSSFLSDISANHVTVIDASFLKSDYIPIDFSTSISDLNNFNSSSSKECQEYIRIFLEKHNKTVAYGGYLETRAIYKRSPTFNKENSETERNIHLGIDLWVRAGTQVLSAFDGEIHSFKNNIGFGDYGPTIIIKHYLNSVEFYTLYGHLSRASITNLRVGQKMNQGQILGEIGTAKVNGDYAPHLHFQIIKDLQSNFGDYPGVTSSNDLEFYKNNCPDPNLVLKL